MNAKKVEPKPRAVSVDRAANIGLKQVRTTAPPPLFKSGGFKAPMAGTTHHPSGSQKRHK